MAFKNLTEFIALLEKEGELKRIKTFVDPVLEIAEITDRVSKASGPALLFENTGTDFPVLINAFGSEKRMALALGVESLDNIGDRFFELFKSLTLPRTDFFDKIKVLPELSRIASWMPKVKKGKGECQEVIMETPDMSKLPVLKCWFHDGGPFVTLPIVHTRDPHTGIRNVGMYRMQVFNKTLTGMHWHLHKVSARHYNEYKKLGKRMPVSVALGGDPIYTYCATAPLPDNFDEYIFAGFLRQKKVELVKCITNDIEVPADADIVLEGYVDVNEEFIWEGPFGDHTGFYSLPDWYPRFHITCITHRKNAIYPATIVGIPPQEDAWLGKATERIFLTPIRMTMVPEIIDMIMPVEGCFHNLVIVKINKTYPGQAKKVMNALWGAGQMMFTKVLIIVSEEVNINNYQEVLESVSKNFMPTTDMVLGHGPNDVLDHASANFAHGGKLGIDATFKLKTENLTTPKDYKKLELAFVKQIKELLFIININVSFLEKSIPLLIVGITKNAKNSIKLIHDNLLGVSINTDKLIIIVFDDWVDINSMPDLTWLAGNNIDPERDIMQSKNTNETILLSIDATFKSADIDDFQRDWPSINLSDKKTIEQIDAKWERLNIGEFINSPSNKYLRKKLIDNYKIL